MITDVKYLPQCLAPCLKYSFIQHIPTRSYSVPDNVWGYSSKQNRKKISFLLDLMFFGMGADTADKLLIFTPSRLG